MKKFSLYLLVIVLVSSFAISSCRAPLFPEPLESATATPFPTATAGPIQAPATGDSLAALETALGEIYHTVNPSVVNIQILQRSTTGSQVIPEIPGMPFAPQDPQPQSGLGSGFVWDDQGRIVTNNHVVAEADEIDVTFYDGTTVQAEILGLDPDSDLAVIEVDMPADRLHPVQTSDSTLIEVGELVVAIGNPFGLEGTMTVGFVSAIGRSLPVQSDLLQGATYTIPDIIQTDAPINPGNSGGVLVDDNGKLIGVTAAIESPVRANAGIGFAIPSVIVQKVVPALIEAGHYEHPWLGISGMTLTPDLAQAMDLEPDRRGVLVADVTSGSPADDAGLQGSDRQAEIEGIQVNVGGDIILAIEGQSISGFGDLVTYLARYTEVGQKISLTVLREGEKATLNLALAARPNRQIYNSQQEGTPQGGAYLGIVGMTLIPEIAQAMDLPADQEGVLIERVQQDSPADQAGLQGSYQAFLINGQPVMIGGDVIVYMDNQEIEDFEDLFDFLQEAKPDQVVECTLLRDGEEIRVEITLSEVLLSSP